MKTNYIIIVLCILLLGIVASIPAGPSWLTDTTAPLRQGVSSTFANVFGFWDWIGDVRTLAHERDELAEERNRLLAEVAEMEAIKRQNEDLRNQLSLGKDVDQKLIMANSFGLIERGSANYLLIGKGSEHGVKEGQVVLSNQVLVGRIAEVMEKTSIVQLPQSSNSIIPVIIRYGDKITKGMVKANYNLTAQLEQVLQTEQLEEGSVILTSGEGGTYPPDIVVGKVGKIESSEQDVFQTAKVDMLWEISKLETVFISQ